MTQWFLSTVLAFLMGVGVVVAADYWTPKTYDETALALAIAQQNTHLERIVAILTAWDGDVQAVKLEISKADERSKAFWGFKPKSGSDVQGLKELPTGPKN